MGNIHLKDFFNNQENLNKQATYIQNFFSSGLLQHSQFLSDQWTMMNIEKSKEGSNFFDWNNVPASSLSHDQVEEKMKIQEFKENLLIGQLPKNAIEDLLNPAFYDEAQSIYSPSNVVSFKDHQNHIFLLLYHYFYLMQAKRKSEVFHFSLFLKKFIKFYFLGFLLINDKKLSECSQHSQSSRSRHPQWNPPHRLSPEPSSKLSLRRIDFTGH